MKEFIISEAQTEKAVLVGLITPEQNEQKVREYLDELAFLADTAGVEAVKRFYQKLDYPNSVTFAIPQLCKSVPNSRLVVQKCPGYEKMPVSANLQ